MLRFQVAHPQAPAKLWKPRDNGKNRMLGKNVLKAAINVHGIIAPKLIGIDVTDQGGINKKMVAELVKSKN